MALKLQYANSVIPIETVALLDTTNVLTSIYSHADKSYGGGKTIDVAVTGGIVVNNNFTTSATVRALGTEANNNAIFSVPLLPHASTPLKGLGVFIKKAGSSGTPAVEATGTPDVIILLGTIEIKISGIGDGIFLPLNSVAQASISIKSSATTTIALVEIIAIY